MTEFCQLSSFYVYISLIFYATLNLTLSLHDNYASTNQIFINYTHHLRVDEDELKMITNRTNPYIA